MALERGAIYSQVAAGGAHTVLLPSDGRAATCGDNADGQCDVPEGTGFAQVAAGMNHILGGLLLVSLVGWLSLICQVSNLGRPCWNGQETILKLYASNDEYMLLSSVSSELDSHCCASLSSVGWRQRPTAFPLNTIRCLRREALSIAGRLDPAGFEVTALAPLSLQSSVGHSLELVWSSVGPSNTND